MSEMYSTVLNFIKELDIYTILALSIISIILTIAVLMKVYKKAVKILTPIFKRPAIREVSRKYYWFTIAITIIMGGGLALQNAMYGAGQGTTALEQWVSGGLYFSADMALILFCHRYLPYWMTLTLGAASIITFATLSAFAALSWNAGLQHAKDNYAITSRQEEIQDIKSQRAALPPNYYTKKEQMTKMIRTIQREIDSISGPDGPIHSGSAANKLIAGQTEYSFDQVNLGTKTGWSMFFVMGSIALGGLIATIKIKGKNSTGNHTKPTDDDKQGVQPAGDEVADAKFYSRAFKVIKNKGAGESIGITALRKKISTNKIIQNDIIKQLIEAGEMEVDTSKAVHKYTRLKPMATKITNIFGWKKKG